MTLRHIATIAIITLTAASTLAQPQPSHRPTMQPREFQHKIRQELTRQADFTAEEADAFFRIYNEMREQQRTLGQEIHQLKQQQPDTDAELSTLILTIKQKQVAMAELEHDYYKRLLKAVPPAKLLRAMRAEDDIHRRIVQGRRREHTGAPH